jgi:AcrR family transcriptional regulator
MTLLPVKQIAILTAAKELFWKHGFRRVSIEEVCAKGKVSKMTFYRYYANKTELAKAVFEHEANTGMVRFREILHEKSSPAAKIDKLLRIKLEGNKDISQEFLLDFYKSSDNGLKEFIEEKTREIWTEILEDFRLAQKKGIFRKDIKPEFLLYITQQFAEMITNEKLMRMYPNPQDLIGEMTNFFIYGIAAHTKS